MRASAIVNLSALTAMVRNISEDCAESRGAWMALPSPEIEKNSRTCRSSRRCIYGVAPLTLMTL